MFRERLAPDYVLRIPRLAGDWVAALIKLGKTGPFWRLRGGWANTQEIAEPAGGAIHYQPGDATNSLVARRSWA